MKSSLKIKDLETKDSLAKLFVNEYIDSDFKQYLTNQERLEQGLKIPLACVGKISHLSEEIIFQELMSLIYGQYVSSHNLELSNVLEKKFYSAPIILFNDDQIRLEFNNFTCNEKLQNKPKYIQRYFYLTDNVQKHEYSMTVYLIQGGKKRSEFESLSTNYEFKKEKILSEIKKNLVTFIRRSAFDQRGRLIINWVEPLKKVSELYQLNIFAPEDLDSLEVTQNLSDFGVKDIALLRMLNVVFQRQETRFLTYDSVNLIKSLQIMYDTINKSR